MRYRVVLNEGRWRTLVLVLEPGQEVLGAITRFAQTQGLDAASLVVTGIFDRATLGWFNVKSRAYKPMTLREPCEALGLAGEVTAGADGEPRVNVHGVLRLMDGSTRGGHLLGGYVRANFEVTLVERPAYQRRPRKPAAGRPSLTVVSGTAA
jgi:predicted DNA-binding protein with PD1-like motif